MSRTELAKITVEKLQEMNGKTLVRNYDKDIWINAANIKEETPLNHYTEMAIPKWLADKEELI